MRTPAVRFPTHHDPAAPTAPAWVVAVLAAPGPAGVLHPYGVSPLPDPVRPVACCGTHLVDGVVVSWAYGYVAADDATPAVWFSARHGLHCRPAGVRRLTTTVWAAQLPGRWSRVQLA